MAKPRIDTPGQDDPGRGRRLGIDIGDVRVGVVVSDPDCILATPVEAVTRVTEQEDPDGPDVDRPVELATELEVVEIVVGIPLMLDGSFGTPARGATDAGSRLQRQPGDRVVAHYADEWMTAVMAQSRLYAADIDVKSGWKIIDQAATVETLQSWLDRRAKALDEITD